MSKESKMMAKMQKDMIAAERNKLSQNLRRDWYLHSWLEKIMFLSSIPLALAVIILIVLLKWKVVC